MTLCHCHSHNPCNRILSKVYLPRSQDITMMSQEFNSGLLVSFASGGVGKELLDETTIK